jgi:hypothetical protein
MIRNEDGKGVGWLAIMRLWGGVGRGEERGKDWLVD